MRYGETGLIVWQRKFEFEADEFALKTFGP